jgi:sialate O-acetylesterase
MPPRPGIVNKTISTISISLCCALISCCAAATAAVRLPALIGDHMVLQRGRPVPIWGWAEKGEEVTVSIAGQTLATKAGDDGRWKVVLAKLDVGQPLEMTVKGSFGTVIPLKNILVGEVWVCSGQSNMEMAVSKCNNGQEEVAAANCPQIHLFMVPNVEADEPIADVASAWTPCTPQSITANGRGGFSAVAYFFGRQLQKELNVPVGLIDTTWSGTAAERWTSQKALKANPLLKSLAGVGNNSLIYNGMIAPLMPYAIRGAIWYQGEANVNRAFQYRTLLPAMIANWRADWGQGDFPFGFVQIAPFSYHDAGGVDPACGAELWEAQAMTLKSAPNTGMAVTVDIADVEKIHPKNKDLSGIHPMNKQEVGRRLALWAFAKVYGRELVYSGPIYKSMAVEGNNVRLQFDHVGGGLIASDGKPLSDFIIAGADQKFVPAVAKIDGCSIVVHSDQVAQPAAVRYAWHDDATPNLANKERLPASPFRTDSWKGVTEGRK